LRLFSQSLAPAKVDDIVEFDELWSFVQSKAQRVWVWIALCRQTKQVVAYHLGNRDKKSFLEFYNKVPLDYANCLSTSDGFEAYKMLRIYGHSMGKKKEGRTAQVEAFNTILRQRLRLQRYLRPSRGVSCDQASMPSRCILLQFCRRSEETD